MREILFRGKCLIKGNWAYGNYEQKIDGKADRITNIIITHDNARCSTHTAIDHNTLGQYTGLKDKNGNKIFEGDILSISKVTDGMGIYYHPTLKYPANVVVKWDFCCWMWEVLKQDKYYISFPNAWCHYECEVIGNIHDNPEMMKGE